MGPFLVWASPEVESFDPSSGSWSETVAMNTPRVGGAAAVTGGPVGFFRIFVDGGGDAGNRISNSVQCIYIYMYI